MSRSISSGRSRYFCAAADYDAVAVVFASCGWFHTAVIDSGGFLYTFGADGDGALGHGDGAARFEPAQVMALADVQVVQVGCGNGHTLALSAEGAVFAWGSNFDGRLGLGDGDPRILPVEVAVPTQGARDRFGRRLK